MHLLLQTPGLNHLVLKPFERADHLLVAATRVGVLGSAVDPVLLRPILHRAASLEVEADTLGRCIDREVF